jgi:hypothetical protein
LEEEIARQQEERATEASPSSEASSSSSEASSSSSEASPSSSVEFVPRDDVSERIQRLSDAKRRADEDDNGNEENVARLEDEEDLDGADNGEVSHPANQV